MGFKEVFLVGLLATVASAQNYKVCVSSSVSSATCQSISKDDSQASCLQVESRLDCALKLARNEADIGYFTEEETMLLALQQPNDHRVIATIRSADKLDDYSFETVAIVPATHTNGLEGLRGGVYCHPGLDSSEVKWSPRVLKNLEQLAAHTDRCPSPPPPGETAEAMELQALSEFFSAGCRPGSWSANSTVDANLKSKFEKLCSLCGSDSNCNSYTIDMGVTISGVRNDNRHIQALECLRTNSNGTVPAVAYVAWQHVREFFTIRNADIGTSFAVMCTNGTVIPLTTEILNNANSPCAFVRQPWGTLVASTASSTNLLASLRTWWPAGSDPGGNSWQSHFFTALLSRTNVGSAARVVYQNSPLTPLNYTSPIRTLSSIDSTSSCMPSRRWCSISTNELAKCNWIRSAAYTLGIEPTLSCQQRASVLDCLGDIKEDRSDFISAPSNYGYIARQHYQLTPVKLVQNLQSSASRIGAFIKENSITDITRFENLREKKACFPEYGGLAYVSFVRAGQEREILAKSECDYAKVVGEYFSGACAPGALDAAHALSDKSSFNSSVLCSVCKPAVTIVGNYSNSICTWDYTNMYFGNNGSLACLSDPETDVAFLNLQNSATHLTSLGLQATQFRALCRNNTLAASPGFDLDNNCLLAYVVDAEVVTRRDDPYYNSLNTLFDTLDQYFGYNAAVGSQLINMEIFSPFDGSSNLLFKDSTIGLTEPSIASSHEPARNYIELFSHLQACTGAANPVAGQANRTLFSAVALILMTIMTHIIIY